MAPMWRVSLTIELYELTAFVTAIAGNPPTRHCIGKFSP
jgi:hypothetical protein